MNLKPTRMARLEANLRQNPPNARPPTDLHSSIVDAVQSIAISGNPQPALPLGRWVGAVMFATILALGAWWGSVRSDQGGRTLGGAASALQGTQNIPEQASAAMLAPLSQELEFLNRDFRGAVDFVVAAVP